MTTAELPPPAARSVYRLTDEGRNVIPVLRAMARFGVRYLEGEPAAEMSAARAANSLLLPWRRPVDAELRVRLDVAGSQVDLVLDGRDTRLERPDGEPDVVVKTDSASLVRARHGETLAAQITGSRAREEGAPRGVRPHTGLSRLERAVLDHRPDLVLHAHQHARVGEDPEPVGQDHVQDQLPDIIGIHCIGDRAQVGLSFLPPLPRPTGRRDTVFGPAAVDAVAPDPGADRPRAEH